MATYIVKKYFIAGIVFYSAASTTLLSFKAKANESAADPVENIVLESGQSPPEKQTQGSQQLAKPEVKPEASQDSSEPPNQIPDQSTDQQKDVNQLEDVIVTERRLRIITPLPGLAIDRGMSTTNIHSASDKELAESKALNVTEFLNSQMQSVSVTDYAGNPFQQDLNFRGFTASPAIGTPQGISVYMDGVRINEPFGEIVNWGLIPMNALASLDLIPGTNPMFGLNTLGGALALRTKTGFSDEHTRAQVLGGSWGRLQTQISNGINNGTFGLFTAYNQLKEDGWRVNSPSNIRQLYNQLTLRLPFGELNVSALNIDNKLVGNGLLPYETADINREAVFTSPDESRNDMNHYNVNAQAYLSDAISLTGMAYSRKIDQSAVNGDIYDTYNALQGRVAGVEYIKGVFNLSDLKQNSEGLALQMMLDSKKHQMVLGATLDSNKIHFLQGQKFGEINDISHVVTPVRDEAYSIEGLYAAKFPVTRNDLNGQSTTKSIFFTDTWSPLDDLHITFGARYNWTNVTNNLTSDRGIDLYQFAVDPSQPNRGLLDPLRQRCALNSADFRARFICSEGDYNYQSFNPALGITWQAQQDLAVYANISRGARTPTVIELGCANDKTKDNSLGSTNYQYGCSIPTALSSDPYLEQVRSTAFEAGFRGATDILQWNVGWFRTDLTNDILFVPLGRKNRGLFDNFGGTRREGLEMGLDGTLGKNKLHLSYTFLEATFESAARTINESNSSNTAPITLQAYNQIEPGDSLPGLPNHIIQAGWSHQFNDKFDFTINMVAHSSAFVRGNENNDHQPRAASNATGGGFNRDPNDYIGGGKTAGYIVFNLRANYKFNKSITLFAKVDNLFNKKYATAGDLGRNSFDSAGNFITDSDAWNKTTCIGPGAPLAAWVGLDVDLDWTEFK